MDSLKGIDFIDELKDVKKIKAILYTKQENILTIDKLIQQAAQIEPSNFHVWFAWGVVKKLQDDLIAAEKYLRKALEIKASSKSAQQELGRVLTFKGKYREAEEIFLRILGEKSDINSIRSKDLILHISDNYACWANDEFDKKHYKAWKDKAKNALESISLATDFDSSDKRIYELYKKICLDYGLRLFQMGDKKNGERFLLRIIAEIGDNDLSTNTEVYSHVCYYLAKHELSKPDPNWKMVEDYVKKGLKRTSNGGKITKALMEYKEIVSKEKRRQIGQISSFDQDRKFGIITNKRVSCIFFPNCLTWHCKDIAALINRKVSFIPVQHISATRPKNLKATQIKLLKTKAKP